MNRPILRPGLPTPEPQYRAYLGAAVQTPNIEFDKETLAQIHEIFPYMKTAPNDSVLAVVRPRFGSVVDARNTENQFIGIAFSSRII